MEKWQSCLMMQSLRINKFSAGTVHSFLSFPVCRFSYGISQSYNLMQIQILTQWQKAEYLQQLKVKHITLSQCKVIKLFIET